MKGSESLLSETLQGIIITNLEPLAKNNLIAPSHVCLFSDITSHDDREGMQPQLGEYRMFDQQPDRYYI